MVSENEKIAWPYILVRTEGPRDPHAVREAARMLFDEEAPAYDRSRPGYPEELFSDLRSNGLSQDASVLEVGCGTGQATRQLATDAREVVCVEIGPRLADLARENLASFSNVRVLVGAFEDVVLPPRHFDLVFSGTAFHWIDPSDAFARAARVLRAGGSLALATNIHVEGGNQGLITDDLATLQADIAPEIGTWQFPKASEIIDRANSGGDIAHVWSRIERSFHEPPDVSGIFGPPFIGTYEWNATYATSSYLEMLSTQSAYIALDAKRRERFLQGVGSIIDERLGGTVTKAYIAVLAVADVLSVE